MDIVADERGEEEEEGGGPPGGSVSSKLATFRSLLMCKSHLSLSGGIFFVSSPWVLCYWGIRKRRIGSVRVEVRWLLVSYSP
jgi:hypothetical protein